ncbi:MAG: BlaI/MecI/CopY family transcriptional regulator [Sedimentisphaerales bacterium]|nr:BlaI/MecI/CopY family transcriptional regulator [Sedimentisphaerales bacterium]
MKLTQAEWQIMNALWEKHPATARDIMTRLPKDVKWAYTTLKTMLSRLSEKEAVSEQKQSNTSVYEPLISQRKARLSAFRLLLDQSFDGAMGPLMHFMLEEQKLNAKQKKELIEILQNESEESGETE